MTNGHSTLRIFFGGTTTCYEINKSIQPNYSDAWKAHLCPESLQLSVRSLARGSNCGANFGAKLWYPRKEQSGPGSSRPWERTFWEEILRGGPWTVWGGVWN